MFKGFGSTHWRQSTNAGQPPRASSWLEDECRLPLSRPKGELRGGIQCKPIKLVELLETGVPGYRDPGQRSRPSSDTDGGKNIHIVRLARGCYQRKFRPLGRSESARRRNQEFVSIAQKDLLAMSPGLQSLPRAPPVAEQVTCLRFAIRSRRGRRRVGWALKALREKAAAAGQSVRVVD